jgi:hypothetical protein
MRVLLSRAAGTRSPSRAGTPTDMAKASALDRALSAVAAGVFASVARLRGARGVHAHGVGFEATLTLQAGSGLDAMSALGGPRTVRALVRLSPSFDIPSPLPDFLGLAIKLPDLHGPGRDQDFLLVSAIGGHLTKYVPLPARSYSDRSFSSMLPYRSDGRLVLPGAVCAGRVSMTGEDAPAAATAPCASRWPSRRRFLAVSSRSAT